MNEKYLDEYKETLTKYEQLCDEVLARSIKMSGQENSRTMYGIQVYTKISMHALAIQKILPLSCYNQNPKEQIWDLGSLPVLIRALFEAYYAYFYIMTDNVSEDQFDFRFQILDYHSENERLRMLEQLIPKSTEIDEVKKRIEEIKSELNNNPLCKKLEKTDNKLYKKIMRGGRPALRTNEQLSKDANIAKWYCSSMQTFLSQYVHTTPFSINEMYGFRHLEDGDPRVFAVMLKHAINYLAFSIRDFAEYFGLDVDDHIQDIIVESEKRVQTFALER